MAQSSFQLADQHYERNLRAYLKKLLVDGKNGENRNLLLSDIETQWYSTEWTNRDRTASLDKEISDPALTLRLLRQEGEPEIKSAGSVGPVRKSFFAPSSESTTAQDLVEVKSRDFIDEEK